MADMTLGFIGGGHMATALMKGLIGQRVLPAGAIHVHDISKDRRMTLARELGVINHELCHEMLAPCPLVVLAVKPDVAGQVLAEQRDNLRGKALISIVAGWSTQRLQQALDPSTRVLRVMPNTPALCAMGMTAMSLENTLTLMESQFAKKLFESIGRVVWLHESQIDGAVGVSGSGPAYAYLFIEALADAGVAMGIPWNQAVEMAAQTVKGAAEMVLSSGQHVAQLKNAVCSPGGTTIQAVRVMEKEGLRRAVMEGALAAWNKARSMGQ